MQLCKFWLFCSNKIHLKILGCMHKDLYSDLCVNAGLALKSTNASPANQTKQYIDKHSDFIQSQTCIAPQWNDHTENV